MKNNINNSIYIKNTDIYTIICQFYRIFHTRLLYSLDVFFLNFNPWSNDWTCLKMNDYIGKLNAEFIEAKIQEVFTIIQAIIGIIGLLKVKS